MYLNYFPIIQQILSGLVVSGWLVWRTGYLGHGFEFSCLSKKKKKHKTVLPCVKIIRVEKAFRRMLLDERLPYRNCSDPEMLSVGN